MLETLVQDTEKITNHDHHEHDHSILEHDESLLVSFFESVDVSTLTNPVMLGMVFFIWWYTQQAQNSLIERTRFYRMLAGGGAVVVGLPTLYHTVGHKYGLPHFPGEAILGEIGLTLGTLGTYYGKSVVSKARLYGTMIKSVLKKTNPSTDD